MVDSDANEIEKSDKIEDLHGSKARIKILKTLAVNGELNISLIVSKTRLKHSIVLKHLTLLESYNIIQKRKFGRIKIYRYNYQLIRAISLKKFIQSWEGLY